MTSKSTDLPRLAIVVPCHNEQEVLRSTLTTLLARLASLREQLLIADSSNLYAVDDGSSDSTWQQLLQAHREDPRVVGLRLGRNFGHQNAILAGMLECDADVAITIDADLQDGDECIEQMIRKYHAGFDIVLGVRSDRSTDSVSKRLTAGGYYRTLRLMGVDVTPHHADCRLLSRHAINELRRYPETNLFLRGIVPLLGLRTCTVSYRRLPRTAGQSKYSARRMVSLAWEGVTSFSITPLRLVAGLGFLIALGSLAVTTWALAVKFVSGAAVPGWASTVVPMYFLGGVQILCLGVLGEYVGKIYLETKRRPRYSIEARLDRDESPRSASPFPHEHNLHSLHEDRQVE